MTNSYMVEQAAQLTIATIRAFGKAVRLPILLTGGDRETRSEVLRTAAIESEAVVVNMGIELPTALLNSEASVANRSTTAMLERVLEPFDGAIFLDHIEAMLAPYLQANAVDLLANVARKQPICVNWPGIIRQGRIRYADFGHPECLDEDAARVFVIDITQTER